MKEITHKIFTSIADIGEETCNLLFGDIPEGYRFYKTLEESGFEEFCFYYIAFYREEKIILIAPLFTAKLDLAITIEGVAQYFIRAIRKLIPRFLELNTLFCGSPFGENGVVGFHPQLSADGKKELLSILASAMGAISEEKKIPFIVFKDFAAQLNPLFIAALPPMNFFKIESLPSAIMEIDFTSMDEYLNHFSHAKRKDLRRKLKRAETENITIEMTEDVEPIINDIYKLYLNTYEHGKVKFEKLTKDFFVRIGKNLKPEAKFFLYHVNGKLAAFNLCFVHKDLFIDKFIGFDYDISRGYNLYFVSWFHNIDWCIKNGIRYFQTGQTDYGLKISLGGRFVPLYAYAKHRKPFTNFVLKTTARMLKL